MNSLCAVVVAAAWVVAAESWWSLRPLVRPQLPPLPAAAASWARNPIDVHILAALRARGLTPSPEAPPRVLLRRVYFDLLGLPPSPDEVDEFLTQWQASPESAYNDLITRLLASPLYGERWARHWLDVVHYGETHGYDKDKPRPNAWPYRDYVIRAFNEDRPYARFVQEQVAGDVLFPNTRDGIVALGFLAAGPWDFIGHVELPESKIDGMVARHLDRDDMVSNTLSTFTSLTVHCAQCHNHKFDPIRQEEYYRLQAVFAAVDRADRTYDEDAALARRRAELVAHQSTLLSQQKELARRPSEQGGKEPELQRALARVKQALAALPPPLVVYAATVHTGTGNFTGTGATGGKPRPIYLLTRGDVKKPGKEVGPGALVALPVPFTLPSEHTEGDRRAALARWLSDERHPLTWRSIVNRVWLYHWGRGLVDTPNDFGKMGQLPTHPELLDWLAVEFRDSGQSLKQLHRLIVTSATYRQASDHRAEHALLDAENQWYWRQNRRRLEAEAVRDSMLAVSGRLQFRLGGPSFQDFVIEKPEHSPHYQYHLHDANDPRTHRRSVYRFVVRSQLQPFLTTMDCADPSLLVDKRNQTITPLQALTLLNNPLTVVMAEHFAHRVASLSNDLPQQTRAAFRLALGRNPTAEEHAALTAYAQQHGLASLCRAILNLNEFVFVD